MSPVNETPEEHIARIRRDKFSLALDGNLITRNPLADDLHRAVDELSKGLYSKDIHFVLELIQNAEDNRYDENGKPDLAFMLLAQDPTATEHADGALLIVNNELGFRPEDVDALCAVGKTTKQKREGYIGEKGIGFKSVFRVSSRPHLFSAGYRFCFQREPDAQAGFGFIVPYWVPQSPQETERHADKTCILLPLDAGQREKVAQQLETIAPETILFLRRLKALTIETHDRIPVQVLRDDSKKPIVDFLSGDRYAKYWLMEQEVTPPPDLHEEKRAGVESRTVSIACFLEGDESPSSRVFAFLPTEVTSGYPFLVNADFILSTSRESIQFDRLWNKWLRDSITSAFLQTFEGLIQHDQYKFKAYAYIPLAKTVQEDFFKPPVAQIHAELRQRAVVWTLEGDMPVEPTKARLAPGTFRKLLVTGPLPAQLRETLPVHAEIERYRDQLHAIGVSDLTSDEIVNCLKDDAWLDAQNTDWFADLFVYLSGQSWATSDQLRGLRLLPLEDGRRSNSQQQPVYFPSEDAAETIQEHSQVSAASHVAFLSSKVYERIRDKPILIAWLTNVLGVRNWTTANYCRDLAQMLNRHRDQITIPELVRLTIYIRDHYDALDGQIRYAIKCALPLASGDGQIIEISQLDQDHPLVMPTAMDPGSIWQLVFSEPEERSHLRILADEYVQLRASEKELGKWRHFFIAMGARTAPDPRPVRLYSGSVNQYEAQLLQDFRSRFDRQYPSSRWYPLDEMVSNYRPPRWLSSLDKADSTPSKSILGRAKALLQWLELKIATEDWPAHKEPRFCGSHYCGSYYGRKLDGDGNYTGFSEFRMALLEKAWFPSTHGLRKPTKVFLNRPELRELFGDALPYAVENPSDRVARWLELRQAATVDEMLSYLKETASRPASEADPKVVTKIYAFLSERWQTSVWSQFFSEALILVLEPTPRWVKYEQAVWPDLSDVFGETYAYLEPQYDRQLHRFFVEQVGVADRLSDELYAEAWNQLAETEDADPTVVEAALERIYPVLLKVAKMDEPPGGWDLFCEYAKVWTQNNRFVAAAKVYVPDDGELRKALAGHGVEFAWRPNKDSFADYEPLYRAIGVHPLSERVEVEAEIGPVAEVGDLDLLLTPAAKQAICWYLWNSSLREEYERGKTGALELLLKSREGLTDHLALHYRLDDVQATSPDGVTYFDRDLPLLYRLSSAEPERLEVEVPALVARLLVGVRATRPLEDFIGRVLRATEAKAWAIIDKHSWSLPMEEREWVDRIIACSATSSGMPQGSGLEPEKTASTELPVGTGADVEATDTELPPEEAVATILGGSRLDRTEMPYTPPETAPGVDVPSGGQAAPPARRPGGKLRTYVVAGKEEVTGETDSAAAEQRTEIDQRGIGHVLDYERAQGRTPTEMPHHHKGYDIESRDANGNVRYIEVKSLSGDWDTRSAAGLTRTQFDTARQRSEQFWLYVVERAAGDDYQVYRIQDPANRVNQYLFDDGWQALAERSKSGDS